MALGLSNRLSKTGLTTPGIVTSNLVLKHNYTAGNVVPVSDGAAYFDNSNDYIAITEQTYSVHDTAHSFTFWSNRNALDNYSIVLGHTVSGSYSFIMLDQDGNRMILEGDNADNSEGTIDALVAGVWNHFAIVATGSSGAVKMYQNGVEVSVSGTTDSDVLINRIGIGATSTNPYDGYLCNIGIWAGRALTQAEVKSVMNKNYAGLTSSEKTSLQSWWNLSADANDSHGSNNGTLS